MTMNPAPCCWGGHSGTGGPVSCGDCPVVRSDGLTDFGGFRLPCSDSDDANDDVEYGEGQPAK